MQVSGKMDGVRQDGRVSAGVRQDGWVNAGVRQDASQNIQNSHQRCKSHCLGQVTFIRNETPKWLTDSIQIISYVSQFHLVMKPDA